MRNRLQIYELLLINPGVLAIEVDKAVEMAAGAGDQYWAEPNLPSGIKHCILRRYLPIFLARTSMTVGRVVLMDGYAGRGVYEDGSLGSAGMMLEWALERRNASPPVDYVLRFFEKDLTSFNTLSELAATYRAQGVDVAAERADVVTRLQSVVEEASGLPLFLFIDPTGVGLPFGELVSALNRPRNQRHWPPTEALINFSYQAIRRIGGLVRKVDKTPAHEKALLTLDQALGGDWWRSYFVEEVSDEGVEEVVAEFITRLAGATDCFVASIPVRRERHHKPLYSLVFASRYRRAEWHFGDCTAKCLDEGRRVEDERKGQLELSPSRKQLEDDALGDIESNLLQLSASFGVEYTVGDYPEHVFGDHWGEVGETVVRRAIKSLHSKGLTPSTGVGGKTENLRFAPNP